MSVTLFIEVHGPKKQGAGFGYSGVRGLNALLATVSTETTAPVIIGQRLRKGASGSPRGAARIVADALKTATRIPGMDTAPVLLRADSAYYGHATVAAARKAGADVSITARQDPAVKRAIGTIGDDAWTKIQYTDAIYEPDTDTWTSVAEVAEVPFTAFSSKPKKDQVEGRLVVRRIPKLNKKRLSEPTLFDTHRFHAFFTTSTLDTVTADQVHRRHAIIEQVNADLESSALAHLPSGVFTANAAWLVLAVIAFNLIRTAASITGADLASATTATIRRKARQHPRTDRVFRTPHPTPSPRTLALGNSMVSAVRARTRATARLTNPAELPHSTRRNEPVEHRGQRGPQHRHAQHERSTQESANTSPLKNVGGSRLITGPS